MFKSILHFLLEKYEIYEETDMQNTMKNVMDQILPKKQQIIEGFTRMMKLKGDHATMEQLKMNLLSNDVVLSNKEM